MWNRVAGPGPVTHDPEMGKHYDRIDERLRTFIEAQPLFFVSTAPLAGDGRVNVSPKGREGCLAILDEHTIAYLDFGGSHAETVAHLRENGRITLMWCAFSGPPSILRVYGRGEPIFRDDPRWPALIGSFGASEEPGVRAIVMVTVEDARDSCGFAVPFMDLVGPRELHADFLGRKSDEEFVAYCEGKETNRHSLDGLPAVPMPMPARPA
jgi:hypothetical protein